MSINRREFIKKSLLTTAGLAGAGLLSCNKKSKSEKPNIIVIMADDMGFSDIEPFGSEIPTPNLSELADNGYLMTQFYNAARCCPTRASLLTGLYPHQAGIGAMNSAKKDSEGKVLPAYRGYLNDQCVTIAEVLKSKGYQTGISGKWHVGTAEKYWPAKRGFDKSFAYINGAADFFDPLEPWWSENQQLYLTLNDKEIKPKDDFYMTTEISDYASKYIQEFAENDSPFFLYVPYTAPHWPLHALEEDIEKFTGKYKKGFNYYRKKRYEKLVEMGLIDSSWPLSPQFDHQNDARNELTPDWDELSEEEKNIWDRRMAVYAAMIYRMDIGIGKIINKLKETGAYENTLILFFSDNGGCHEPIYLWDWAQKNEGEIGSPESFDGYGFPWANVSNTPFRLFKHWTMEGGIATPFIAHWPKKIKNKQIDTKNVGHVIDLMTTCVDIAGAEYPDRYKGNKIRDMEGMSLARLWEGKDFPERTLYWEHEGNWAVRQGKWKLVNSFKVHSKVRDKDELYNIEKDRVENNDLADKYPEKVRELKQLYEKWADNVGVYNFYRNDENVK